MKLNTVICGKAEDVLKTFPDDCIDLTVTSPPYDNYLFDNMVGCGIIML